MMEKISSIFSQSVIDALDEASEDFIIKSQVPFLREHQGWHRGKLHLLMGTTSGGKTTLVRTLLLEFLITNQNLNLGFVFSEEETVDLVKELKDAVGSNMPFLDRSYAHEELSSDIKTIHQNLEMIKKLVIENDISLLIYDNLTTSRFYMGARPDEQVKYVMALKQLAKEHSVAILIVAHTQAGINDNGGRLIDPQDIRGNKSVSNLTEFLYILQRFQVEEDFHPYLMIKKNRGYVLENSIFYLIFDKERKAYTGFNPVTFKSFKEIFKKRNKL